MTQTLLADRVWDDVEPWPAGHTRLDAAIGYIGSAAGQVLTPAPGSQVVVDGSPAALAQGLTCPSVPRRWVRAGVQVASLDSLHAKCMVIPPKSGRKVAGIGSANASQHSANQLRELAVLLDPPGLVRAVEYQLPVWWMQADPVDRAWLTQADTLYRPPRGAGSSRRDRAPVVDPAAPLWLGEWRRDRLATYSSKQRAAVDQG